MQRKRDRENDNAELLRSHDVFTLFANKLQKSDLRTIALTCWRGHELVTNFERSRIVSHPYRFMCFLSGLDKKHLSLYLRHMILSDPALMASLTEIHSNYIALSLDESKLLRLNDKDRADLYSMFALRAIIANNSEFHRSCEERTKMAYEFLLAQGFDAKCCLMRSVEFMFEPAGALVGNAPRIEKFQDAYLNLHKISMHDDDLSNLDLSWANLSYSNIYLADFANANMTGTDVTGLDFKASYVEKCNLDNVYRRVEQEAPQEQPSAGWRLPCAVL